MEENQKSEPTLWLRWHQQTWKRRFAVYCGGFVLLIVLFYIIENTRGTMALNAAKQRAADAGIDLNFAKLMTQEMPPDEENFAACLEAIETIGHFPDLLSEFNGLTPHFEQQSAAPRYRNFGYAVSADYSFNFDPRKSSHEVGCREILRLLNG